MKSISKWTPWIEKAALSILILYLLLRLLDYPIEQLLMVGLNLLAMSYFLHSYAQESIKSKPSEKMRFNDTFASKILPKTMWLSCTISTVGLTFYFLQLIGYEAMLLVGTVSLAVQLFLSAILFIMKSPYIEKLSSVLTRAVPLWIVGLYILLF